MEKWALSQQPEGARKADKEVLGLAPLMERPYGCVLSLIVGGQREGDKADGRTPSHCSGTVAQKVGYMRCVLGSSKVRLGGHRS